MVEGGADLGGELHARDHASGDPELTVEEVRRIFEMLHVRSLVGQLEVASTGVVAIDLVDANRLLDQRESIERSLVALVAALGVAFEQGGEVELEAGVDH